MLYNQLLYSFIVLCTHQNIFVPDWLASIKKNPTLYTVYQLLYVNKDSMFNGMKPQKLLTVLAWHSKAGLILIYISTEFSKL